MYRFHKLAWTAESGVRVLSQGVDLRTLSAIAIPDGAPASRTAWPTKRDYFFTGRLHVHFPLLSQAPIPKVPGKPKFFGLFGPPFRTYQSSPILPPLCLATLFFGFRSLVFSARRP